MTNEQFEEVMETVKIDRNKERKRLQKNNSIVLTLHEIMLNKLFDQMELWGNIGEYVSVKNASDVLLDGLITLNYLLTFKGPKGDADKKHSA